MGFLVGVCIGDDNNWSKNDFGVMNNKLAKLHKLKGELYDCSLTLTRDKPINLWGILRAAYESGGDIRVDYIAGMLTSDDGGYPWDGAKPLKNQPDEVIDFLHSKFVEDYEQQ